MNIQDTTALVAILCGFVLVVAGLIGFILPNQSIAQSVESYPSVQQLQQALNAYPGAKLPPQVTANGRVWTGYYVSAKAIGSGRYSIIIELK